MSDVNILIEAIFWPTLIMGLSLGLGVSFLLRLRPQKGY